MLTLPIKKKWFDMILSGEKKEEYREIKPYYHARFVNSRLLFPWMDDDLQPTGNTEYVVFRNGFSSDSPTFVATVSLRIGTGRPEWGAEPGVQYYVLEILEIVHKGGADRCGFGIRS